MSSTSAKSSVVENASPDRTANLLRIMKLEPEVDTNNFNELTKWVMETGKSNPGASAGVTATVASLLLLRVTRAFQKRMVPSQNSGNAKREVHQRESLTGRKNVAHDHDPDSERNKSQIASVAAVGRLNSDDVKLPKKVKVSPAVMQALMFLGSDLKNVLHSTCTPGCDATIADVADFCLQLLDLQSSNTQRIGSLLRCMLLTVRKSRDEEERSIFKTFVQQTFETLRFQAVASTELSFDFEFLYENCCKFRSFQQPFHLLKESYQAAWKLSRYFALRLRFENPRSTSSSGVRRSQVLGATASLAWMAALGNIMPKKPKPGGASFAYAGGDAGGLEGQPPSKRPRIVDSVPNGESAGNEEDVLEVLLGVANKLFTFLAWASPDQQDICAISRQELEQQVLLLGADMCSLQLVRQAPAPPEDPIQPREGSAFSRALHDSVPKMLFMGYNYKAVVDTLVLTTQQLLNPTMAKPTPMSSVLFLAPTVIGEPWGLPKMIPQETAKLLCLHTTQRPSGKRRACVVVSGESQLTSAPEKLAAAGAMPKSYLAPAAMVITDSMELNEWTLSVLSLSSVKPSDNLLHLFSLHDNGTSFLRSTVAPVLNRAISRIQRNGDSQLSLGTRDGLVYVSGEMNDDVHFCAALVGFYYHSLEAILENGTAVTKQSFLNSHPFHRALMACCFSCMLKAVANYPNMMKLGADFEGCTIYSILETLECSAYTYLKVAEPFYRVLTAWKTFRKPGCSPIVFGLPRMLQTHMERTEVQVLDSVVWLRNTAVDLIQEELATAIQQLRRRPGAWPPEALEVVLPEEMEDIGFTSVSSSAMDKSPFASTDETSFLSYLLRRLLKVSYYRIQALCHALSLPVDPVANQVFVAFRYLLRNAVDLLYDRHVDQSLLCTIYAVCKILKVSPAPTFARVTEAYLALHPGDEQHCQLIFRRVNLGAAGVAHPGQNPMGDIIMFYNSLFVPRMRQHLLSSKSLKRSSYQLEMMRMASVSLRAG